MVGGAWWAAIHGVPKSWARLSDFTFTFHFHALEKEMATHSSVLAWRIPGMGEPDGLPSMGSHRVGHYWSDLAAAYYGIIMLILQPYLMGFILLQSQDDPHQINHPKGNGENDKCSLSKLGLIPCPFLQFSSVSQSCPTLCNSMDCSRPGLQAHHQLPEFTQTHDHWVGDAIQPSHPLSPPSPPTFSLSQHQGLFQWVLFLQLQKFAKLWNLKI